jgi:thiol-disulfide isomerase/thioredoxin
MRFAWMLIGFMCLVLGGCNQGSDNPPGETKQPSKADADGETKTSRADADQGDSAMASESPLLAVPLVLQSWDEAMDFVAKQKGKVVVLDIWSTWCIPCMKEFPNLVALQREHGGDIVCVSVNVNYEGVAGEGPETFREPVATFLKKKDAQLTNIICTDPSDEVFTRLQLASIPAVLVYDRAGGLAKRFDNDELLYGDKGFNYEQHVNPLVEKLLAGESAAKDVAAGEPAADAK